MNLLHNPDRVKPSVPQRRLKYLAVPLLLGLGGCVVTPPELRSTGANTTPLKAIEASRSEVASDLDKQVRWGGTVARVENLDGETRVEIIAKPLYRYGRPDSQRVSQGRFIASFNQFLDPADYRKDREITVVGTITSIEDGKVGQADYQFPVVQASAHELWNDTSNSRFAQRRALYHNGYGRWYDPHPYGFNARYHNDYLFADWWLPAFFWSLHGYHGHHHRSRLHFNVHMHR